MDKFKIGDTVRFKTSDELFETYLSESRTRRCIIVRFPFYDGEVGFYSTMYSLLGTPFKILDVFPDGSIKGCSSIAPYYIWRVMPKWLATDDDDNIDFDIDEERVFQII